MLSSNGECITNPQGICSLQMWLSKFHLTVATTISTTLARAPDEYPLSWLQQCISAREHLRKYTLHIFERPKTGLNFRFQQSGAVRGCTTNSGGSWWVWVSTANPHSSMSSCDSMVAQMRSIQWCFPAGKGSRGVDLSGRHASQKKSRRELAERGFVRRKCLKILQKLGYKAMT